MSGAYTDYPVSPLASLAKLIATGYKLYNYSQTQKQDELERQRKEQEARIEAERQAREYDQTQAAQALQMGQWAQTGQGWQMLQQPEYQEQFRRAGGVLPIQSQQMQGQGVNPTGPMPLSALSNAKVQNTYQLPEKPEDLWTVEEWYAKNGLAMPDEAKKYAKVPMQKALQYKLVNLTPPDPDAELAKRFKLAGLLTDPDAQAAAKADPMISKALIDRGIPTTGTATPDGQVLLEPAWNVPQPKEILTYRQLGYTPKMVRDEYLDQPAHLDAQGNAVVRDYMQPAPAPDNSKAVQAAQEDLDDLTNKLADAVAKGDEVNAIRYWGQFKARRAKYAAEMPDIDTLFPLEPIETVKQNVAKVKTEKAQAKIKEDANEYIAGMKAGALDKLNAGKKLLPGEELLVKGDDNLLQQAIRLAQTDPIVQAASWQAMGSPEGQAKYNAALQTALKKYTTLLGKDALPANNSGGEQPLALAGTNRIPKSDTERRKRTDAVRSIINAYQKGVDTKKATRESVWADIQQDATWYNEAELAWMKRLFGPTAKKK
jgi:hypothetical protein